MGPVEKKLRAAAKRKTCSARIVESVEHAIRQSIAADQPFHELCCLLLENEHGIWFESVREWKGKELQKTPPMIRDLGCNDEIMLPFPAKHKDLFPKELLAEARKRKLKVVWG